MRNGSFNRSLAIKGIANNFVPMIARDYKKHNGSIGSLTIADKRSIASKLIGDIINNARDKFKKMKPLKRKSTARRKSIFIQEMKISANCKKQKGGQKAIISNI